MSCLTARWEIGDEFVDLEWIRRTFHTITGVRQFSVGGNTGITMARIASATCGTGGSETASDVENGSEELEEPLPGHREETSVQTQASAGFSRVQLGGRCPGAAV